jgi:hypothetical protein
MRKVFKSVSEVLVQRQYTMFDGLALAMGDIANPSGQMNAVSSQMYFHYYA